MAIFSSGKKTKAKNLRNTGIVSAINANQAMIEFNLDGTIVSANKNFLKTMGYDLDEIIGEHHSKFVRKSETRSVEYKEFWEKLNRGESVSGQFERYSKSGEMVKLEAAYNAILDENGKPAKVIKIASDITAIAAQTLANEGVINAINTNQAMIEFELDGTIVSANENFLKTTGYTLDEIIGQKHSKFVSDEYRNSSGYEEFWAKLNRGETIAGTFERFGKDGNPIWLEAAYNSIKNIKGKPYKVIKIASDITKAQQERLDNEGIIGAIDTNQAMIEFELDGTIISANENFLKTMGYRLDEIIGQKHNRFVSDEYRDSNKYSEFWAKLNRGETIAGIFERFDKQGKAVWLEAAYNAVKDAKGRPYKVIKIASDITDLQIRRRTNAGIIEAIDANQAMIEFTMDGKVVNANENFLSTMGYSLDEIVGQHHSNFVGKEERNSREYEDFWAKLRKGESVTGQFDRYSKDGILVKLDAAYNSVHDANGRPFKVIKIATDITEASRQRTVSLFKGSAFDGSSMAMMMVDRDLQVTFVNAATMQLFGEHAEAFKEVFPNFTPDNIVGTCIDVFHKNPAHQRALLSDESRMPFRADISVGDLKFALSVSIVRDLQGKHVGNTLEWDHVTEARTNAGIMGALNRDSALIEFNLDGSIITANENFLTATGYTMSEIKGKHHRMFVARELAQSAEYSDFWKQLNNGQSVTGKFERFGKTGNQIWLDASYTSVLDINGKPFKVVKIASDITDAENARTKSEADLANHAEEQAHVVEVLASSLKGLSEGNLTSQITETFSGEYEQLRNDFNSAVTTLNATMGKVIGNAVGIQNGASEISQASDDMAKRTENQAAALEETAAALDEITATVQGSAKSADQANTVVGTTRVDAENSGEVVRKAVDAMDAIKDSSGEIEKIIGVIDEIAFQTNLLALNAGVEAARAGEAGRGFAVVASEVRALAQRSSDAAKDIKDLISASGKHVETGVDLVGQTGEALSKIVISVAEVSKLVSDIAGSAQEQSTALAEVNSAVNDMDRVTQQNAAMVEESTAAAHALTNEAQELTRLVRQFDIGDNTGNVSEVTPGSAPNARGGRPPVAAHQQRAQAYFATQGSAAIATSPAEDDWQDF